mmetsp:Transcript_9384/g.29840  ORF Transcript_9384/g.29840 Transcript_9384/m.29840 type:complete len:295 (-) Transcript_9384:921-1805(-)
MVSCGSAEVSKPMRGEGSELGSKPDTPRASSADRVTSARAGTAPLSPLARTTMPAPASGPEATHAKTPRYPSFAAWCSSTVLSPASATKMPTPASAAMKACTAGDRERFVPAVMRSAVSCEMGMVDRAVGERGASAAGDRAAVRCARKAAMPRADASPPAAQGGKERTGAGLPSSSVPRATAGSDGGGAAPRASARRRDSPVSTSCGCGPGRCAVRASVKGAAASASGTPASTSMRACSTTKPAPEYWKREPGTTRATTGSYEPPTLADEPSAISCRTGGTPGAAWSASGKPKT